MPFLPTPPLNTGLMKTEPWRSISALISSSLASGPSTSAAGKSGELQELGPVQHACDLHRILRGMGACLRRIPGFRRPPVAFLGSYVTAGPASPKRLRATLVQSRETRALLANPLKLAVWAIAAPAVRRAIRAESARREIDPMPRLPMGGKRRRRRLIPGRAAARIADQFLKPSNASFQFQRRPRGAARKCAGAGRGRNARLARHRHVGDGDEPSRQGVHGHRRPRWRPICARCSRSRTTTACSSCRAARSRRTPSSR